MSIHKLEDKELINAYLEGEDKAFEVLLNRHKDRIYTSIYMFVKETSLAEDLFQEVFIKIVDTLRKGRYNHEGKFVQWALRISYNMCVDYFRRNKRKTKVKPTEDFDIFDILESPEDNMEQSIMKDQTYERVRHLIDQLPPEQKEVVILRHYADMSFKEIAQITRVSINTALGRMRYALINLRKIIEDNHIVLR